MALAAVALVASSAALAEVKVSGTINAGIASNNTKNENGDKVGTNFAGAGGYVAGNAINFSGSEDLGGGLKAGFTLGAGFDAGNGSSGNGGSSAMFTQQANVSLGGDVGTVKLGMQLSPFISAIAGTGFLGDGNFWVNRLLSVGGGSEQNPTNGALGGSASSGGFFVPNSISYTSPSISGFTFTGLTTAKTGTEGSVYVPVPLDTNKYTAFSVTGSVGDVNIAAAYHKRTDVYSGYNASANVPFGDFTIAANYISVDYADNKAVGSAEMVGVKVGSFGAGIGYKVSDAISIAAQTASNDITGGNQRVTGFSGKYTLSKSTFAYLSYVTATNGASSQYEGRAYATNVLGAGGAGTAALSNGLESNRTMSVGLAHSF